MTVCVSVKVHDAIVFSTDSATSISRSIPDGSSEVVNVYDHGVKLFNLHKKLPIMAMTCGLGHFGSASISNMAKELRYLFTKGPKGVKLKKKDYTVKDVAEKSFRFLQWRYTEAFQSSVTLPQHDFEFIIGGYSDPNCGGEVWKIVFSQGRIPFLLQLVKQEELDSVNWAGQTGPIGRLLLGHDSGTESALVSAGLSQSVANNTFEILKNSHMTPLVHSAMPIIDAVNLTDFLVDVTKRYFGFLQGADIVGGETEIATVTRHEGFKWVRRKHYYPASLNRKDNGHV